VKKKIREKLSNRIFIFILTKIKIKDLVVKERKEMMEHSLGKKL
jgi:hypothetical protein